MTRSLLVLATSLTLGFGVWLLGLQPSQPSQSAAGQPVHVKLRSGARVFAASHDGKLSPLFQRTQSELIANQDEARALGAVDIPDLSAWYRIDGAADPEALSRELSRHPDVEMAFVAPKAELAILVAADRADERDRCPIETPTYDELQGYLAEAPSGIDVAAAWSLPGGRGGNVAFADIEGAWNEKHEDIPGERMKHVAGREVRDRGWVAHGTAVVGVVASKDNKLGMIGIAPNVPRVITASLSPHGPASAIDQAQARLSPGDVLLIELHAIGPRRRYLPMEYWDDVYDAVKLATGRGVIVVAAAGNGDENLDHEGYDRKFDRSFRDSGAILVGAGAPAVAGFVDRSRLDFSNYGERVDVQGWGRKVASLDYGDLQDCGAPHRRKYTAEFGGTSSASPIVASGALLLQSIHKERMNGAVLSPIDLRALLRRTGSRQQDGPMGPALTQPIGPRPNLSKAIAELPTR